MIKVKVTLIESPCSNEILRKCYDYILKLYRREMQKKLTFLKTETEFRKEKLGKGDSYNA